jgi:mono/diheme cytochrome c family protein
MKNWTEGKAAFTAVAASITTLAATFGLAAMMRQPSLFSVRQASITMSVQAAERPKSTPIPVVLTAEATQGRHLFLMNCAHCHGDDARGDEGPTLHDLHKSDARIHQVITGGIKGEMPSFGKKLGDPEIQQLTAYLRALKA